MNESSRVRLGLLFLLTLSLSGCSLISITQCTFWNVLPALGFHYAPPVCPGGQATFTTPPPSLPTATFASERTR